MARMHSRKRGKSGSSKPIVKTAPSWIPYKEKELEMLIGKLSKEGLSPSQIGLTLRDSYGIPDLKTVLGKNISQVLREKKLEKDLPEDVLSLMRKAVLVSKHMQQNKGDMTAKRGLQLTESKIKRLVKYYQGTGRIDPTWKYSLSQATFYVD